MLTSVLLDTHAWAWSLSGDPRLSRPALAAIASADAVFVSPISFFEIARKVRLGTWPQMEPLIEELPSLLQRQGGLSAAPEPAVCVAAGLLAWLAAIRSTGSSPRPRDTTPRRSSPLTRSSTE